MNEPIDLSNVDAEGQVVEGKFAATIIEVENKQTKAGNGIYLKVILETDGGVRVRDNINFVNPNPVAERIGRQRLRALLVACGLPDKNFSDAQILQGARMTVQIKKDEGPDGVDYPKVAKYLKLDATKGVDRAQTGPGVGATDDIPF